MMMGLNLKELGATLPPGFRFFPTDEELVCHYLTKKIVNSESFSACTNHEALNNHGKSMSLVEINLHTVEPWQLPEVAKLNATEWYFFSFRDRKYATGFRTNRATGSGYWKATGKDRTVVDPSTRSVVGMRKTLVFYKNRAPNGIKTGWIMHEFRLETPHLPPKEDWVLCRVFHKAKVSAEHPVCTSNLSSYQLNNVAMMLPFDYHNQINPFSLASNHNSILQNTAYNYGAREDMNNPATATSSVTEIAPSMDGAAGCEEGQDDFIWNNMNLMEINSFMEPPNNIQGDLQDHMDANSLAFF